jgi:hypothetical protein
MRKLLFMLFALSMLSTYSQGVIVLSEAETESIPTFEAVMNQWMGALKTTMNIEDARMNVFREQGTRKLQMLQWFDSLSDMAKYIENQDANNDKIIQAFQGMTPMAEGTFEKFGKTTDFKESTVWKFRPDLSTADETFSPLSQEEKDKTVYRRVQYMSVDFGQNEAFEANRKKTNELDKSLGIKFHVAVFENVFGSKDADYMVILLDNSRFDYHKNWEARMEIRRASQAWQDAISNNNNLGNWSVLRESSWNRIVRLTH